MEWYDVLYQLRRAGGRLSMSALAEAVLITAPNCTRLVDRLEAAGLVRREASDADARVRFAVLTDEGVRRLREASPTHVSGIRTHFVELLGSGADEARAFYERVLDSL